ncbi:MAG: hypothetical protein ACT4QF_04050 [Sporichthyaceae bacterium]
MGSRRSVAFAASLLLLGSLGACGGGSGTDAIGPVAAVQRAAESASTDSAKYTLTLTGTGVDVRGTGAFRGGADPVAQATFDRIEALGMNLGGGLEYRLVDRHAYLKLGEAWQKLPADAGAVQVGPLDSTVLTDPMGRLRAMLDTDDVVEVGTETIDGTKTTHYRARTKTVGLLGSASPSPAPGGEVASELEKALRERLGSILGGGSPQVDVWVDERYRARRFVLALPMLGGMKLTVNVGDYGTPLTVAAPADAENFGAAGLDLDSLTENVLPENFLGEDVGKLLGEDFGALFGKDFADRFQAELGGVLEG